MHLWVEDFLELFTTVMVAYIFVMLGVVREPIAIGVIFLDVILYSAGGVIGTMHHLYFSGTPVEHMALGAFFSALEIIPLTFLTIEAWTFLQLWSRQQSRSAAPFPHRWAVMFLFAVGFWNFLGAGVFGFLINLPIVSYYQIGTALTANHAHGSMMGVNGMMGVGLSLFALRYLIPPTPSADAEVDRFGDRHRSREGVQDRDAGRLVVGHIARDHGEAVHQRRRGDLLVQRILRMWDPQPPPYLRDLLIECEDRVSVITCDRAEPTREASRLREVAAMAHGFNALAQLADRDRRQEQRYALRRSIPKEPTNTGVGASALSRVADDVCIDEVHGPSSRPPVDLAALEVGVFAGVGHCREYLSQRAAPRAQQRLLENFPMLLLGAVIAPGGALLELPHDGFVDVTDHELSHVPITSSC